MKGRPKLNSSDGDRSRPEQTNNDSGTSSQDFAGYWWILAGGIHVRGFGAGRQEPQEPD